MKPSMKNKQCHLSLLLLVVGLLISGCHIRYLPPIINGLKLEGFEQVDGLTVYNKNNLFDYMNGEAEAYLPLGFQLLYLLKYEVVENNIQMVVEAYDMGSRSGAEGVFQQYTQDGGLEIQALGDQAWTDNYIVLMRKGEYFLRITPDYSSSQGNNPELGALIKLGRAMDCVLMKKE